ncbi:MAG: outer membrane protein assembly factor BamA, partial [Bacteroidales bacterium]|nr:outer membrane protein assembly factor BamA [Bacteroidales bacterium]
MMKRKRTMKSAILMIILMSFSIQFYGQDQIKIYDYSKTIDYIVRDINVIGVKYLNESSIIGASGLMKGQSLSIFPGGPLTEATQKLWDQGLFSDVRITYTPIAADTIDINIQLQERPRVAELEFVGVKSGDIDELKEKINIKIGSQVSSYILNNTENIIKNHYIVKGFLYTDVSFIQKDNPNFPNSVVLTINVDKKKKVKIEEITFEGNDSFDEKKLRRKMKGTKIVNLNIFKASKYIKEKYNEDKLSLISFYNDNGFKDFEIISDSLYTISDERVGLHLKVNEGNQYHIRNINWVGNSIYTSEYLQEVFDVEKGSVYNRSLIYDRLRGESGAQDAVDNLYLNNGYLFSSITPIESKVENDSIDLEIRIYEGDQAYLNDIIIIGNDKTNEHVARRELYTLPGDLFNKESIIRSVRQLGVLGHWDAEKINPTPITNQTTGDIDLQYDLEEKANDQFEISGGWGAGMIIGTIGLSFNNFSMRNFFKLS